MKMDYDKTKYSYQLIHYADAAQRYEAAKIAGKDEATIKSLHFEMKQERVCLVRQTTQWIEDAFQCGFAQDISIEDTNVFSIRPCPFCGHKAEIDVRHIPFANNIGAIVFCPGCQVETRPYGGKPEETFQGAIMEAIAAWNNRGGHNNDKE